MDFVDIKADGGLQMGLETFERRPGTRPVQSQVVVGEAPGQQFNGSLGMTTGNIGAVGGTTGNTGSGAAFAAGIDCRIAYVDLIIATKN